MSQRASPNNTFDRTADSHSLAAAGQRGRYADDLVSTNRGADVFLADERRHYLGRTCSGKLCRPGVSASRDALHCGRRPHLHDDLATVRRSSSPVSNRPNGRK